jgi:hypothetical protein
VGLIKELVLLPVAPLRFTVWVADQVAQEAERQQFSPGARVQQLEEVEEAREKGELDEEEAADIEGEIIEQHVSPATPIPEGEEDAQRG